MLSRLAAKQLSVIVASGPSSLAAQEVKVPISFPIPLCFVTILHCVLLVICAHCTKNTCDSEISKLSSNANIDSMCAIQVQFVELAAVFV